MTVTAKKGVLAPRGFVAATAAVGIRKSGKKDLMLLCSERPAHAAGLFTVNQFAAAPVVLSRAHLSHARQHVGVLMNSGSANACTGKQGFQDALELTRATAAVLGCTPEQILIASTGVIGQRLPVSKVAEALPGLRKNLQSTKGLEAAQAIMTTDLVPKMAETTLRLNGEKVTIGGIAKGSGMIHPNMATMLCLLTTDAAIPKAVLTRLLKLASRSTFNAISVDGECSTNDTVFLLANGAAGPRAKVTGAKEQQLYLEGLTQVMDKLAQDIVLDGEGATKLMDITVRGAKTEDQAMTAARAIGDSQLVKTAVYGEDANWGRILQSLGATTISLNPQKVSVKINGLLLVQRGLDSGVSIARGNQVLKKKKIVIEVDLHLGSGQARYRTCDLSKAYIDINAGYRS